MLSTECNNDEFYFALGNERSHGTKWSNGVQNNWNGKRDQGMCSLILCGLLKRKRLLANKKETTQFSSIFFIIIIVCSATNYKCVVFELETAENYGNYQLTII